MSQSSDIIGSNETLFAFPDAQGHFGRFGGQFVSETLMAEHHIEIFSMVGIDALITYLKQHGGDKAIIETLDAYRQF